MTAVRDDSAWRANLDFAGNQPLHPGEGSEEYFVVCRDGSRIAAYARVTRFHGVSMIMEYGYLAGEHGVDAMLATFKYLGESAGGVPVTVRRIGDHRRAALLHSASKPASLRCSSRILPTIPHSRGVNERNAPSRITPTTITCGGCSRPTSGPAVRNGARGRVCARVRLFADSGSVFWTADRF